MGGGEGGYVPHGSSGVKYFFFTHLNILPAPFPDHKLHVFIQHCMDL